MDRLLAAYRKGDLKIVRKILFVLAAASALFTYGGASLDALTFVEKARSTVFAIASGCAIYLIWDFAINIVPELLEPWKKALSLVVILCWCVIFFFLSSSFNAAWLKGRDAQELHQSRYVEGMGDVLDATFTRALSVESVSSDLRLEAARYKTAAEQEFKIGLYSGKPGPGAVFNALGAIQKRLIDLDDEVADFIERSGALNEQARHRLETVRKIATSSKSTIKRMRDIETESDALRANLARMDSGNLTASIARTLESLPGEVDLQTVYSSNRQLAKRQRQALDKVRADIERTSGKLRAFIDTSNAQNAPRLPAFEKMTAVQAVKHHWESFIPFWAGSIALDIAPLGVVIFLMIGMSARSREELAWNDIMQLTLEDVARSKMGSEAQRLIGIDSESANSINRKLLGREARKTEEEEDV